jgi:lipopolysaccharide biosynthesis protein
VVTANDSLYGPFAGFAGLVARLRASAADVVGLTESLEIRRHFQSYLLAFKPRALRSAAFRAFWRGVRVGGRQEVIDRYELALVDRMEAAGLTAEALFPAGQGRNNPTLTDWRALIVDGFPYI